MNCISYTKLTNFIGFNMEFDNRLEFLSIHTGGQWRRYKIYDGVVSPQQFFAENIPDFDCYIQDIFCMPRTNRLTINLAMAKDGMKKIEDILTIRDFYNLVSPYAVRMIVDNGVEDLHVPNESDLDKKITRIFANKTNLTISCKF